MIVTQSKKFKEEAAQSAKANSNINQQLIKGSNIVQSSSGMSSSRIENGFQPRSFLPIEAQSLNYSVKQSPMMMTVPGPGAVKKLEPVQRSNEASRINQSSRVQYLNINELDTRSRGALSPRTHQIPQVPQIRHSSSSPVHYQPIQYSSPVLRQQSNVQATQQMNAGRQSVVRLQMQPHPQVRVSPPPPSQQQQFQQIVRLSPPHHHQHSINHFRGQEIHQRSSSQYSSSSNQDHRESVNHQVTFSQNRQKLMEEKNGSKQKSIHASPKQVKQPQLLQSKPIQQRPPSHHEKTNGISNANESNEVLKIYESYQHYLKEKNMVRDTREKHDNIEKQILQSEDRKIKQLREREMREREMKEREKEREIYESRERERMEEIIREKQRKNREQLNAQQSRYEEERKMQKKLIEQQKTKQQQQFQISQKQKSKLGATDNVNKQQLNGSTENSHKKQSKHHLQLDNAEHNISTIKEITNEHSQSAQFSSLERERISSIKTNKSYISASQDPQRRHQRNETPSVVVVANVNSSQAVGVKSKQAEQSKSNHVQHRQNQLTHETTNFKNMITDTSKNNHLHSYQTNSNLKFYSESNIQPISHASYKRDEGYAKITEGGWAQNEQDYDLLDFKAIVEKIYAHELQNGLARINEVYGKAMERVTAGKRSDRYYR